MGPYLRVEVFLSYKSHCYFGRGGPSWVIARVAMLLLMVMVSWVHALAPLLDTLAFVDSLATCCTFLINVVNDSKMTFKIECIQLGGV